MTTSTTLDAVSAAPSRAPSGFSRFLRITSKSSVVLLVLCALLAVAIMVTAYAMGDNSSGMVVLGDDSVLSMMHEGVGMGFVAWIAITGVLMLSFVAVFFSVGIALLSVVFAFTLVALVGLLMAAPALILFALLVWVFRKAFGSRAKAA